MTYYMHILKDPKFGQKHITGRKFGTTCNFAKHLWEISRKYAKQEVPNAKDYGNDYCHKRPWRWTQVVLSRDKSVDFSRINQVSQIYSKNVTVQHKVGPADNNIYQAGNSYRVKKRYLLCIHVPDIYTGKFHFRNSFLLPTCGKVLPVTFSSRHYQNTYINQSDKNT
jgi:hypothetical protein